MTVIDDLLANNTRYVEKFDKGDLPLPPGLRLAVVACMDARLDTHSLLGIGEGDAHVIRNAGGVVTDDAIRSLTISQRLLGTTSIMLIHYTDCGMLTFRDDDVKDAIMADTGLRPAFALEAFGDLEGGRATVDGPNPGKPLHSQQGRCTWLRLRVRDGETERGHLTPAPRRRWLLLHQG